MKGISPRKTKPLCRLRPLSTGRACSLRHLCQTGWTGLITVLVLCALLFPVSLSAQTTELPKEMPQWIHPPEFTYSAKGKPDPFHPVIQNRPEEVQESEAPKRQLTPLEKVKPSQLELVGILNPGNSADESRALVELPNGKGYILTLGTAIGQHRGKVTAITADTVVIRETRTTVFGKKKKMDTVLKLHKQPGQNNG
ncbi:MAG: pilus assembly protein PilP [Desulfohalobiaceae bacterium]|nr:pilus assembly protein PilP [Desulfohalobiaceae bacterium]